MSTKIIDISKYQQKGTLDFDKLKASGIEGVIIRASYGNKSKDNAFESHYEAAKKAGLPVGAYHYCYSLSVASAKSEAFNFLENILDKQFELPVYLDIEDPSQEKLGRRLCTDIAIAFCSVLEKAGYFTGVYANTNWFKNILYRKELDRFTQWEANYSAKPQSSAAMWQFSCTERFDGYNGDLDCSFCYRDDFTEIIKNKGLNGFDKTILPPETTPDIPGDIDGDGIVTAADARLALRASALLENLTPEQFIRADMDGDGQISAADARKILRISAGLD